MTVQTGRPLVAVFLGTDHHPFDRLVSWVSELSSTEDWAWFVQHGSTERPVSVDGAPMLSLSELEQLMMQASAVVTHGGPGLIMEARAAGHQPVVIPRNPTLGEHVDGHQERFCARAAASGLVTLATSRDHLRDAVADAVRTGRVEADHGTANPETTRRFGELVHRLVGDRRRRAGGILLSR